MEGLNNFLNSLILIILSISTVISVLEQVGWLPKKVRKYLKLSRSTEIIEILEELGIDVDKYRRSNVSVNYPKDYSKESVEKQVRDSLKQITINKPISIGRNRVIKLESYVDLIGYSCDSTYACYYARLLSTYWAEAVKDNDMVKNPLFDFVVTPKGGSPILGYEFSKLIGKPFMLHEDIERFKDNDDDFRKYFNCASIPERGARFLIVDDSTTGGALIISVVHDLKKYGYMVTDSLVVFELTNKDARKKLKDEGVNLVSLTKVHQ